MKFRVTGLFSIGFIDAQEVPWSPNIRRSGPGSYSYETIFDRLIEKILLYVELDFLYIDRYIH